MTIEIRKLIRDLTNEITALYGDGNYDNCNCPIVMENKGDKCIFEILYPVIYDEILFDEVLCNENYNWVLCFLPVFNIKFDYDDKKEFFAYYNYNFLAKRINYFCKTNNIKLTLLL